MKQLFVSLRVDAIFARLLQMATTVDGNQPQEMAKWHLTMWDTPSKSLARVWGRHISIIGASWLVNRGRHVGSVISWGGNDQLPVI